MLVLQLSDLHVKAGRALAFNAADSAAALERTVDHLRQGLAQSPDCVVITGDLAEHGEKDAYALVAEALSGLTCPVYVLPGNHDQRGNLLAALGPYCPANADLAPYLCYVREDGPVRLVFVDGTQPNSHSGRLDDPVALWLEHTLAARRDMPTLVFTHHPPFLSGLGIMDEPYENANTFVRIMRANPQARLCCGHLHRGMVTTWNGVTALCAPPLVMEIELDLSPKGGDAFILGAPGYLLHHLHAGEINTHFCRVPGVFPQSGPYSFANPPAL